MAMMGLPRYRHQTLSDLQHLVLDPLVRDRVAIAYPSDTEAGPMTDIAAWRFGQACLKRLTQSCATRSKAAHGRFT